MYILLLRRTATYCILESGLASSRLRAQTPGGHRYLSRPLLANSECDDGVWQSTTFFTLPVLEAGRKEGEESSGSPLPSSIHPSVQHSSTTGRSMMPPQNPSATALQLLAFRWWQEPPLPTNTVSKQAAPMLKPSSSSRHQHQHSRNTNTLTHKLHFEMLGRSHTFCDKA